MGGLETDLTRGLAESRAANAIVQKEAEDLDSDSDTESEGGDSEVEYIHKRMIWDAPRHPDKQQHAPPTQPDCTHDYKFKH